METFRPKGVSLDELTKKAAAQRVEALKKTEEERKKGVVKLHQDEAKTATEIERLQAQLDKIKNEKERKEIYARLAKLVEENKKISKQIKKEKKTLSDQKQAEEDAKLRGEEIYGSENAEAYVGTGQFERRVSSEMKKADAGGAEKMSAEDLELRKKEIYQESDEYVEGHVGEGEFEYRKTEGAEGEKEGVSREDRRKNALEMKELKKRAKELEALGLAEDDPKAGLVDKDGKKVTLDDIPDREKGSGSSEAAPEVVAAVAAGAVAAEAARGMA